MYKVINKLSTVVILKMFGPFILLIFVFNSIIHSDSYVYQSMDGLPLGLLTLFALWPAGIFSLIMSIRATKLYYQNKNVVLCITSITVLVATVVICFFGDGIYEWILAKKVKQMSTETLLRSNGEYLGQQRSSKIYETRKSDLYSLLNDSRNSDVEERILFLLRKEKDEKLIPRYENLAKRVLDGKITNITIYSLYLPVMTLRRQHSAASHLALKEIQRYAEAKRIEDKSLLWYLNNAVSEPWRPSDEQSIDAL